MKKLLLLLAILPFMISCQNSNAQTRLIGKTYIAKIGETCKDGIGSLYKYRILKFSASYVTISYKIDAYVSNGSKDTYEHMYDELTKNYKWKIQNDILIIQNFEEYGKLEIQNTKIIGKDINSMESIEFKEELKKN